MLDLEEGEKLVRLARRTIETYLEEGRKPEPPEEVSEKMREERGVFVTLRKGDELRGCIGKPLPTQSLIDGVIDSAINASTRDPRFPSLERDELDEVTLEVSVLTQPEEIKVETPREYPEKVKIGRDGLIVRGQGREGLLLPQVPLGRDWSPKDFLSQTCLKAGLSPDCWLNDEVEIESFSAQVFEEKEPGGEIVEKGSSP